MQTAAKAMLWILARTDCKRRDAKDQRVYQLPRRLYVKCIIIVVPVPRKVPLSRLEIASIVLVLTNQNSS